MKHHIYFFNFVVVIYTVKKRIDRYVKMFIGTRLVKI